MSRILIDTNIILDIALNRALFVEKSSELIKLIEKNNISAFITATTVTDIYYIAKRKTSHETVIEFLSNLFVLIKIVGVDSTSIMNALKSSIKDFEDAVQEETAKLNNINIVITRNKSDFINSDLKIYSPEEFINKLN